MFELTCDFLGLPSLKTSVWRDSPLVGLDLPAIDPLLSPSQLPPSLNSYRSWYLTAMAHGNFILHIELLLSGFTLFDSVLPRQQFEARGYSCCFGSPPGTQPGHWVVGTHSKLPS